MTTPKLTPEYLHQVLDYDPQTGIFRWKVKVAQRTHIGDIAGKVNSRGYIVFAVHYRTYLAHRLAWLYITGKWPSKQIDHKDSNKLNNSFANLRDVTITVNQQNRRTARIDSSTSLLGVGRSHKKFRARISMKGKTYYLGYFNTAEEAHAAYKKAKRRHHEGCTI